MANDLSNYEGRQLGAEETGWVRELATEAKLKDGETLAIAVHLPGKPVLRKTVPVYDLFLATIPDCDTIVRRRPEQQDGASS